MKHPVDAHVGKKIRQARWALSMTQQQLAEKVGIKFQQIQKYETGMNRVSASRLWDVSEALGVSIAYFFEGLKDGAKAMDELYGQGAVEMMRDYDGLDEDQKEIVRKLITSLKSRPPFIVRKTG